MDHWMAFIAIGLFALIQQLHADGAIWLTIGALLIILGSADQHRPLARWRVVATCLLPLMGVALGVLHLIGRLP